MNTHYVHIIFLHFLSSYHFSITFLIPDTNNHRLYDLINITRTRI